MKVDERWNLHYQEFLSYIQKNKRRPSKHHQEDKRMVNWLKYNKKLMSKGKLPPDRLERFQKLLELNAKYQRINQHQYVNQNIDQPELNFQED